MTATGAGVISRRETEVLAAVGAGLSNAQIARKLHISVRTVESHVSSLLRKLGAADRRELAAQAPAGGTVTGGGVTGLPVARTSFVGRDRERAEVAAAFQDTRLVTLLGPGGVGKTRLAAVVAETLAGSCPAGGAFVDLVPVRDGYVGQAVAAALGVAELPQQPLQEAITDRLGRGRWLLVLDNCEHLLDPVTGLVDRVLSACPGVWVLVTSRERLRVPGERSVPVAPLPLAPDAELLFHDRATAADPGSRADPGAVAELCARLDGLPLAIELAAARSATLGASGLLAALDDRLRLLTGGRDADVRHRSLRAVLDWSYDLLEQEERVLFRRLAAFAGSFDLDAARAVAGDAGRATVADLLGRLVDKSLVIHQAGAVSRWRLLESVRAYAAEQLASAPEAAAVRARHLRWAAATAAALERRLDGQWRDDFDTVADDLRAAVAGAPAGPAAVVHRLTRALAHLTYARRFLNESLDHYRHAAERAPAAGEAAADLRRAAACVHAVSHPGQAFDLLLEAAERALAAADGTARAAALAAAVVTADRFPAGFRSEVPRERLDALTAEAAAAGNPDDPVVAALLAAAAMWRAYTAERVADPALAEAALAAARRTGDPVLTCAALDGVAAVARDTGRLRDALEVGWERLALRPAMPDDDPYPSAEIVDMFRVASGEAIAAGDLPAALTVARQALADELLGDHPYLSRSLLITPLALTGAFDETLAHATVMWESWLRSGRPPGSRVTSAMDAAVLAAGLRDDPAQRRLWSGRARQTRSANSYLRGGSFQAFVAARLALHGNRLAGAADLVEQAFATDRAVGARPPTYAVAAGAELAVVAGLPDAAARLDAVARSPAAQSSWVGACLARARGRLYGDDDALRTSVEGWERIGARFERACTLLLLPDRAAEGRTELTTLGCSPSAARESP